MDKTDMDKIFDLAMTSAALAFSFLLWAGVIWVIVCGVKSVLQEL